MRAPLAGTAELPQHERVQTPAAPDTSVPAPAAVLAAHITTMPTREMEVTIETDHHSGSYHISYIRLRWPGHDLALCEDSVLPMKEKSAANTRHT